MAILFIPFIPQNGSKNANWWVRIFIPYDEKLRAFLVSRKQNIERGKRRKYCGWCATLASAWSNPFALEKCTSNTYILLWLWALGVCISRLHSSPSLKMLKHAIYIALEIKYQCMEYQLGKLSNPNTHTHTIGAGLSKTRRVIVHKNAQSQC